VDVYSSGLKIASRERQRDGWVKMSGISGRRPRLCAGIPFHFLQPWEPDCCQPLLTATQISPGRGHGHFRVSPPTWRSTFLFPRQQNVSSQTRRATWKSDRGTNISPRVAKVALKRIPTLSSYCRLLLYRRICLVHCESTTLYLGYCKRCGWGANSLHWLLLQRNVN
jgi:hypothetical protein